MVAVPETNGSGSVVVVGSSFFGQSALGRLLGMPHGFSGATAATADAEGAGGSAAEMTGAGAFPALSDDADPTTVGL